MEGNELEDMGIQVLNHLELGRYGEELALGILEGSEDINQENNNNKAPYDILWNGKRIDVKTSIIRRQQYFPESDSRIFKFYTKKKSEKHCDYFLCIGLDENLKPIRTYMIPYDEAPGNTMSFSATNSKYDKFLI